VNLYALALVLELLLGWPILVGIVVAAAIVLIYITLGGLSSAIYNEVLHSSSSSPRSSRWRSSGCTTSAAGRA
jgi:Na+/proline symporter